MGKKEEKTSTAYDYSLLLLTAFLVCFGLVMVYSTSSYNATKYYNDPTYYLKRQAVFATVGMAFMIVISKIDYHLYIRPVFWGKISPVHILYVVCIGLQLAVLIFSSEHMGAKRWLEIGGFGFQPSEITKICLIIFMAYFVGKYRKLLDKFSGFMLMCLVAAPLVALVGVENLSTAIVMMGIVVVICFVAGKGKWYYVPMIAVLGIGVAAFILFADAFRVERVRAWLDIENSPGGYQILQGLYAIASGGLWGKGLGVSVQKLGFVPESHNDMIFSIICEELGLFGAVAVLLLFLLLLWRLFIIAINAPDLSGSLIAVGIMTHVALQVLINVAVVTNSIPATGVTLPFISYGGSSLMIILAEMGVALGISDKIVFVR